MQIRIIAESREQHVSTIHGSITPNASSIPAQAKLPILQPSKIALVAKEQQLANSAQHALLLHPNISSILQTISAQPAQSNTDLSAPPATVHSASPAQTPTNCPKINNLVLMGNAENKIAQSALIPLAVRHAVESSSSMKATVFVELRIVRSAIKKVAQNATKASL